MTSPKYRAPTYLAHLLGAAILALAIAAPRHATADVTPTGDTFIGNNIALVGDTGFGTLDITAPEQFLTGDTTIGNGVAAEGVATITGAGADWENAGPFVVGSEGVGRLDVLADATLTNDGIFQIAVQDSSHGVVNLHGANTRLDVADRLEVALLGNGQLNASGGAAITAQELFVGKENFENTVSSGVVRLSDLGTRMYAVNVFVGANGGAGELSISQGAVLESGDVNLAAIGQQGSQGLATVQDPGSRWDHGGTMLVGRWSANGELRVLRGGVVTADEAFVGTTQGQFDNPSHGEVLIDGVGSLWEVGRDFAVGERQDFGPQNGNGRVTVRNGGRLRTAFGEPDSSVALGGGNAATGEVIVTGLGSRWDSGGDLTLGSLGTGSLTVAEGAIVTTTQSATLGADGGQGALNGHGAITIDGPGSRVDIGGDLTVGENGSGEVHIRGGGVLRTLLDFPNNQTITVGGSEDSYGRVVVDGVGSRLETHSPQENRLVVGDFGRGELEITGGAVVAADSATLGQQLSGARSDGAILVEGAGSRLTLHEELTVGELGDGEITIRDGGLLTTGGVNVSPQVFLGEITGSHGRVVVEGAGSEWTHNGDFVSIGSRGDGELAVKNGAQVRMGQVEIGNATIEVTGTDAYWEVATMQFNPDPGFSVGDSLTIADGGEVRIIDGDVELFVGDELILEDGALTSPRPASVLVRNGGLIRGGGEISGHLINSADVRIGPGETLSIGHSTQNILTNEGRIEVFGTSAPGGKAALETNGRALTLSGGQIFAGDARVRFDSSFLQPDFVNSGQLTFAYGTSEVFGDVRNVTVKGVITVAGDSQVTFFDDLENEGTLNVAAGSRAIVFGDFSGAGNIGGGDVELFGQVAPGASPGVMQFGGDLTLGFLSELQIEIGGTAPGAEYDRVEVEGVAHLDGTLKVELIDLGSGVYEPKLGDSFGFLASNGGAGGDWHTLDLPELAPGLEWLLNPGGITISLNVVAALEGDYNFDGVVDAADYAVWREALGQTGLGLAADGDLSGVVDSGDFDLWKANYGEVLAASVSTSTPEPATLLLTTFAAAGLAARRRK